MKAAGPLVGEQGSKREFSGFGIVQDARCASAQELMKPSRFFEFD
jgi:hypothetical protein